jgi:SAM-dependent methyltransferase
VENGLHGRGRLQLLLIFGLAVGTLLSIDPHFQVGGSLAQELAPQKEPYLAPYAATPEEIVEEMLRLAEVGKDDVVYDLGSGDGRIVIAAAKRYGARGIGFEIDPKLVRLSRENARRAGVAHLVEFHAQDVLTVDLSPATVVTLYLFREANLLLRPRIQSQLRPGSRVVSHDFDMGDWQPGVTHRIQDKTGRVRRLYLWRIPPLRPSP